MIDPIFASCTLIAVFVVLLAMGAPIGICIVIASFSTMMLVLPFDISMFATAQKCSPALDSFALLAVPFFVLSGVIMNSGELPPGWSILPNCLLANCPARSLIPTSSAI